jgi:hypothetical protein
MLVMQHCSPPLSLPLQPLPLMLELQSVDIPFQVTLHTFVNSMKYLNVIKSICLETALVGPMTTDVIHSFISHTNFIYLLKLLYFCLLCVLAHSILISRHGDIHHRAFSFLLPPPPPPVMKGKWNSYTKTSSYLFRTQRAADPTDRFLSKWQKW